MAALIKKVGEGLFKFISCPETRGIFLMEDGKEISYISLFVSASSNTYFVLPFSKSTDFTSPDAMSILLISVQLRFPADCPVIANARFCENPFMQKAIKIKESKNLCFIVKEFNYYEKGT